MRTTFTLLLVCCTAWFCHAGNNLSDHHRPNPKIENALKAKYPTARHVEWEMKQGYHVAEFHIGRIEMQAWFDNNGNWQLTESDIPFIDLPDKVKASFLASEYATWEREDVDKVERNGMATLYVIEVEKRNLEFDLYYTADGTLVKSERGGKTPNYLPTATNASSAREWVKNKYPNAIILDIDTERSGKTEIDILDGLTKKEILFNAQNEWLSTTWDVRRTSVPANVLQTLKQSNYGNYRIDDIHYREQASGPALYIFELERNDHDVTLTFNAATGELLSTVHQD